MATHPHPCNRPPAPALSAVILAGGESRRMGRSKAWVQLGGKPLLGIAVETVRTLGVEEVFISGRPGEDYTAFGCPVLLDVEPGGGPLGGIERGLTACRAPLLLVLAVDLPRMTTDFLRALWNACGPEIGAVPRLGERFEPLAAIYPRRCHPHAVQALAQSRRAVQDFVEACWRQGAVIPVRVAAVDADCFANCNSPVDLESLPASKRG